MGEKAIQIVEIIESALVESNIDKEKLIIKNITILGKRSKNKREYSEHAFQDAVKLFENSPAFYEHSKKSRNVRDLIGKFTNLSSDSDYVRGDLNLLENQKWLLDVAKKMPEIVGFSINAEGKVSGNIVESISKRKSIDLVTNPATVRSLFEEEEEQETKEGEEDMSENYKEKYLELQESIEKEQKVYKEILDLKDSEIEEYEKKSLELKELKEKVEEEKTQRKKEISIQEKIEKSGLKKEHLSKTFLSVLNEAEEKNVDALIKDRKDLLGMKQVVITERVGGEQKSNKDLEKEIMEAL